MDVRVVFEPQASEGLKQHIRDHLDTFNVAATGLSEYYPVTFVLRDARDEILGGLLGAIWGGWLHVAFFWVAEPLRRRDLGSQLLRAAEAYALERGCRHVHLDTFSFQAPGFYARHGYREFGRLDDHPPGHTHHFLTKTLG